MQRISYKNNKNVFTVSILFLHTCMYFPKLKPSCFQNEQVSNTVCVHSFSVMALDDLDSSVYCILLGDVCQWITGIPFFCYSQIPRVSRDVSTTKWMQARETYVPWLLFGTTLLGVPTDTVESQLEGLWWLTVPGNEAS